MSKSNNPFQTSNADFQINNFFLTEVGRQAVVWLQESFRSKSFFGLAIVGHTGSGKTSLMYYLSQLATAEGHWSAYVTTLKTRGYSETITNLSQSLLDLVTKEKESTPEMDPLKKSQAILNDIVQRNISNPTKSFIDAIRLLDDKLPKQKVIVLLIDDLNPGLDERLFADFIKRLSTSSLTRIKLVVGTQKYYFANRFTSLALDRVFRIVELKTLAREDASLLLERLLAGKTLPDEEKKSLLNMAEGSPLILSLFVRYLDQLPDLSAIPADQAIKTVLSQLFQTIILFGPSPAPDLRMVLDIIAALNGVDIGFLSELTGFSDKHLSDIINSLTSRGLIAQKGTQTANTRLELSHLVFREYLMQDLLSTSGLDITNLQFGAEEAERDKQLFGSLVYNPWLGTLLSGEKSIVLGDRGSGKSALFRVLTDDHSQFSEVFPEEKTEIDILSEKDPSVFIQQMSIRDSSTSSAERFKAIWLSFVASLLAKYYLSLKPGSNSNKTLLKTAHRLIRLVGWSDRVSQSNRFIRPFLRVAERLHLKISLKIGPVTVEPTSSSLGIPLMESHVDIEKFVSDIDIDLQTRGKKCRIVIDRVDEVYKYQRDIQEALVQGLFLAETYLSKFGNVDLVLLLRTDLFEIYDIQEKNKFQSRMVTLNWSEDDIISALLKRLYINRPIANIAKRLGIQIDSIGIHRTAAMKLIFPDEIEGSKFEDWLIASIRNGRGRISPRQIVLFLNSARDMATRSQQTRSISFPVFSSSAVQSAMTKLSELSYDEFISDFRIATALVRNLRAGRILKFNLNDVTSLIDLSEGNLTKQIELLERLGYLRRVVERDNKESFITFFEIPELFTRCWIGEVMST